jgi:hypothetical protein
MSAFGYPRDGDESISDRIGLVGRSHIGRGVTRLGEVIAGLGERIEATGCYSVAASKAHREGYEAGVLAAKV